MSSSTASDVISLPEGGGALSGLGETFTPDLQTGTGNFSIPISLPPGRNGFAPSLSLGYSTGSGNGPFGLGWQLAVPGVTRSSRQGVPTYDGTDTFVLSGAEDLVQVDVPEPGVTRFRPRTEGLFARIERVTTGGDDIWRVWGQDGLVSIYGGAPTSGSRGRVTSPSHPDQHAKWHLTSTVDPFGNRIEYLYEEDASLAGAPGAVSPAYLSEIRYVDYGDPQAPSYLVSVRFVYGARPDVSSDRRSGFEIRQALRCERIEIYSLEGTETLTRQYDLTYQDELVSDPQALPANGLSLLTSVRVRGHRDGQAQDLPTLRLDYSGFRPAERCLLPVLGNQPEGSLGDGELDLVDLFGNGLPCPVSLGVTPRFWQNLGPSSQSGKEGCSFTPAQRLLQTPPGVDLADPGVTFADMNGDGRPDLVVTSGPRPGYYALSHQSSTNVGWDPKSFTPINVHPSFNIGDPRLRLVDLTGDGVSDAMSTESGLNLYFNDEGNGWERLVRRRRVQSSDFPNVDFADPRVHLADMTGDGLTDIVFVEDRRVEYWPSLGHGRWGEKVTMAGAPQIEKALKLAGLRYDPSRLLLGDIDGDGLADLLYVGGKETWIWINQGGNGFGDGIPLTLPLPLVNGDHVRLADLTGSGRQGLLLTLSSIPRREPRWLFVDLNPRGKPYLLSSIDNNMGATTRITYAPSTKTYLEDRPHKAKRWRTHLPFPVQVVDRVEVIDSLSATRRVSHFKYHHGHWDGVEREFRGFGLVDRLDSDYEQGFTRSTLFPEATLPDREPTPSGLDPIPFASPVETRTFFHLGPIEVAQGVFTHLDLTSDMWGEDKSWLPQDGDMHSLLGRLSASERRDGLRALRGRKLREEVYGRDGSPLQGKPYSVMEYVHSLREVDAEGVCPEGSLDAPREGGWSAPESPLDGIHRIFMPFLRVERSTRWDRGDEPLHQLKSFWGLDRYGKLTREGALAVPKGRALEDFGTPGEPYLATMSMTDYASRDDSQRYLIGRVTQARAFEVINDGSMSALGLLGEMESGAANLSLQGHSLNYYDGAPFVGLPVGDLGDYGVVSASKALVVTDEIINQAWGGARPPYLDPNHSGALPGTYPADFSPAPSGQGDHAGHIWEDGSDGIHEAGFYAFTARQGLDVQFGSGRGLPTQMMGPLGRVSTITYDAYGFLPSTVTDPLGLVTTAIYDYLTFQAKESTDANGSRVQIGYTPLGLVEWQAVMGRVGEDVGDTPEQPGVFYEYDLLAYENSDPSAPQAPYVHGYQRIEHRWTLVEDENAARFAQGQPSLTPAEIDALFPSDEVAQFPERFIQTRSYSDGFGRALQTRVQAEDVRFGDAYRGDSGLSPDPSDTLAPAIGDILPSGPPRVRVSAWSRFDNKGQVVEQFEPYFSIGWDYAPAIEAERGQSAKLRYDPIGRLIHTLNPDGSEQRVVPGQLLNPSDPTDYAPSPWEVWTFDAIDNAGRTHGTEATGYASLWNTPAFVELDPLGRAIRSGYLPSGSTNPVTLGRQNFDIRGNALTTWDSLGRLVEGNIYDLANRPLCTERLDGGIVRVALDAAGAPLESLDPRGARSLTTYDILGRPSLIWGQDDASSSLTLRQRLLYGDEGDPNQDRTIAFAARTLGRLTRHYDEAGCLDIPLYDFKGLPPSTIRNPIGDAPMAAVFDNAASNNWDIPRFTIDWTPPQGVDIDAHAISLLDTHAALVTSTTFDALGRAKTVLLPEDADGPGYQKSLSYNYNRAGALESVSLDGATKVHHIAYNARGQRLLVAYGNGVMTRYAYDSQTFRLSRLRSESYTETTPYQYDLQGGSSPLQDLFYTFDLAGNPIEIQDRTPGSGVQNNPDSASVTDATLSNLLTTGDALLRRFTYDDRYRLTKATGRQCGNIPSPRAWSDDPRCGFDSGSHGTPNQDNAPQMTSRFEEAYTWDTADNLLKLKHTVGQSSWTRRFGMGGQDPDQWDTLFPQHSGDTQWPGAPSNAPTHSWDSGQTGATHTYDTAGQLTAEGTSRRFEWDQAGRLKVYRTQVTGSEPSIYAIYLYDSAGQRLKKWVRRQGGSRIDTTVYIGGIFERHERVDSGVTTVNNTLHIIDGAQRIGTERVGPAFPEDSSPAIQYHLAEPHGTSNLVVDDNGSWCNREEYSPFGESVFGGFARKRYRYTGQERDEESGLGYHSARYYASWLCRWTRPDPAGLVDGGNLYCYVRGSPIRGRDPSGRQMAPELTGTDGSSSQVSVPEQGEGYEEWSARQPSPYSDETLRGVYDDTSAAREVDSKVQEVFNSGDKIDEEPGLNGASGNTTGMGLVAAWDGTNRVEYKNSISESREAFTKKLGSLGDAADDVILDEVARPAFEARQSARATTQARISPGGREMSKMLEIPRTFDYQWAYSTAKLTLADSPVSTVDVAEKLIISSGKSRLSIVVLGYVGKYLGAFGAVYGAYSSAEAIYSAPESERGLVIAQELGATVVGGIGFAAGSFALVFALPVAAPAAVVIGAGLAGGAIVGVAGSYAGSDIGSALYGTVW